MAAKETPKKEDRIEKLGDRETVVPGDGGPAYWKDTGELVTADERRMIAEFGESTLNFKGEQKQNPDVVFYTYEAQLKEGERAEMNPIRGFVLDIFQRPNNFASADDAEDGEGQADDDGRLRVAAWFLLTHPCWVKTLGKKLRRANIGEKVWVDLNQATMGIVRIAAPKKDNGELVGLTEVAIEPKTKEAFQATKKGGGTETRQAWRVGLYGGWAGGQSFKKLNSADEIKKRLGGLVAVPSMFVSEQDIAQLLGIQAPPPALSAGESA
jgi:hypothetical protein